jgi:hypothetical protein
MTVTSPRAVERTRLGWFSQRAASWSLQTHQSECSAAAEQSNNGQLTALLDTIDSILSTIASFDVSSQIRNRF